MHAQRHGDCVEDCDKSGQARTWRHRGGIGGPGKGEITVDIISYITQLKSMLWAWRHDGS